MAATSSLTCVSAWQMRSLARTEKWCTLGSVFITASYLLTASSYLREQKAGRCMNSLSLSIQQNAAWIIAPTNIIPCLLFTLFSLVTMISYVCQIWCDIHSHQEGICTAICKTRKLQCLRQGSGHCRSDAIPGIYWGYHFIFKRRHTIAWRHTYTHTPLLLDEFLCRQDLFVELFDLLVMAVTLLVIWIKLQALTNLTAHQRRGGGWWEQA